jgi:hypothetical protein
VGQAGVEHKPTRAHLQRQPLEGLFCFAAAARGARWRNKRRRRWRRPAGNRGSPVRAESPVPLWAGQHLLLIVFVWRTYRLAARNGQGRRGPPPAVRSGGRAACPTTSSQRLLEVVGRCRLSCTAAGRPSQAIDPVGEHWPTGRNSCAHSGRELSASGPNGNWREFSDQPDRRCPGAGPVTQRGPCSHVAGRPEQRALITC